ncbi:hypothetical protein SAMN05216588_101233 [Pseudomonas flavescens]|uniref:Uncharacterized protein n=1 Tax=Phytopseudomonas flavescens TaxID=29435 RepID=A0A1G7XQY1_9GAMM|nr:hypothetical protein [Pseudomonas flavescens]SDG86521.1 hypothetical protein SAMN05216588_101233 [Pseudomonas flavescens]
MNTHNEWRTRLDPRAPDYLDPLSTEEQEEEAEAELYAGEGGQLYRQWDFDHV